METSYTPALAEAVLEALAECGSLRKVCREDWAPDRGTVVRWVENDIDGFAAKYARAKELGIEDFAEETIEIADEPPPSAPHGGVDTGAVAHAKVRIETRRWLAERMLPKKFGVKTATEISGPDGGPIAVDETVRTARIAALLAKAKERSDLV